MLSRKFYQLLQNAKQNEARLLQALSFRMLNGLSLPSEHSQSQNTKNVEDFLHMFFFCAGNIHGGIEHDGVTPLRIAVMVSNAFVVKALISQAADIEAPLCKTYRWLAHGEGSTILHQAAGFGSLGSIKALLEARADLQARNFSKNHVEVFCLIWHHPDALRFLIDYSSGGILLRRSSAAGLQVLHWAACFGSFDCVCLLLERHADHEDCSLVGATPLIFSLLHSMCDVRIPKLLLDARANVNASSTPSMLFRCAFRAIGIKCWLDPKTDAGLQFLQHWECFSPLHAAASQGHSQGVEVLLHASADANIVSKTGLTPLMMAQTFGPFPSIESMLEYSEKAGALRSRNGS